MTNTKPPVDPRAVAENPAVFTDEERSEAIKAIKDTTLGAIGEIQKEDFAIEAKELNEKAISELAALRKQIQES